MRLKSLELLGFKSFLDSTTIGFSPGMTAVVGPNGCGKSNVVDAIRWVLGEQAPTRLRGKSVEDLIYAGNDSNPAAGMAEVSLILEGSVTFFVDGCKRVIEGPCASFQAYRKSLQAIVPAGRQTRTMWCRVHSVELSNAQWQSVKQLPPVQPIRPLLTALFSSALSLPVDTVVLGVKNRRELAECVAAAEAGPLPADLLTRIDQSVDRAAEE